MTRVSPHQPDRFRMPAPHRLSTLRECQQKRSPSEKSICRSDHAHMMIHRKYVVPAENMTLSSAAEESSDALVSLCIPSKRTRKRKRPRSSRDHHAARFCTSAANCRGPIRVGGRRDATHALPLRYLLAFSPGSSRMRRNPPRKHLPAAVLRRSAASSAFDDPSCGLIIRTASRPCWGRGDRCG
jgi:hypothetical protein